MKFRMILSVIFILAVSGVLVFNASGLGMINHNLSSPCPVSAMTGGSCPASDVPFAMAIHHMSGVKAFTQATFGTGNSSLFMSALLAIAFLLFAFIKILQQISPQQKLYFQKSCTEQDAKLNSQRKLLRWIAIRNNLDSH